MWEWFNRPRGYPEERALLDWESFKFPHDQRHESEVTIAQLKATTIV